MNKELLSALMDGELDAEQIDLLLAELRKDESLPQDWYHWCLASDTLRGEAHCPPGFMSRFSERLAAEPVVFVPRRMVRSALPVRRILAPLAVAASVAFVGVSVWQINKPMQQEHTSAQIATETESTLRAYLAAHRESDGNPFAEREIIQANFQLSESR